MKNATVHAFSRIMKRLESTVFGGVLFLFFVILAMSIPARAENSDRMLIVDDGTVRYVDFENSVDYPARDFITIFDRNYTGTLPQVIPGYPIVWISGGVVKTIDKTPEKLGPDDFLIVEKFGTFKLGQAIRVVKARPFRPNTYTHRLDFVGTPITASDQMAVYTSKMGSKTPSFVFRRELVVSNGRIIQRGGGNCPIPEDGFVISGHGTSSLWLSQWGMIGARAEYQDSQVTITVDEEAWFRHVQYYLHLIRQRCDKTARNDWKEELHRLTEMLPGARPASASEQEPSWMKVQGILEKVKRLLYRTTESPAVEVRGVFLSDVPSEVELEKLVDRFKSAGINMVIPLSNSGAPSDIVKTNRVAVKFREQGIKTVLWTMLPMGSFVPFKEMLKAHPDWSDMDKKGTLNRTGTEVPDLANAEAMNWWCNALEAFCRQTECDGILFDYEGYQGGFSRRSMEGFIAQEKLNASFDPRDEKQMSEELSNKWTAWRRKLIVEGTHQLARAAKKGKPTIQVVGCFVAPSYHAPGMTETDALHMLWPAWIERGTFDAITTMVYAQDARWVTERCREMAEIIKGRQPLWPTLILYPETGGSSPIEPELLIDQVEGVRQAGGKGVLLFMGAQFLPYQGPAGDDLYRCLRYGLFRSTSR